nr:uncharacterized protein C20orf144 homolog [Camelus dromedarius]
MGNNSSHKRTKVPKQARKDRPPDMDKAWQKQQFFSHLKWKKPSVSDRARGASGSQGNLDRRGCWESRPRGQKFPGARCGRPGEDAADARVASPAAVPALRGAGDSAERREGARTREMKKILVLLLLLDARLQEEGRRAEGGAKAAQGWQRLYSRLLTDSEAGGEADPAEEQPRKRRRCPRPRP